MLVPFSRFGAACSEVAARSRPRSCTIDTMRILLVDHHAAMVRAWERTFEDVDDVAISQADYLAHPADAMVSPANSFGIMDGGLDLAIRDALGFEVQKAAQRAIVERHHGELPVGTAEIVSTGDPRWPLLVVAPTMRVPESVAHTLNAYLAFRAALLACARHATPVASLVCCGLGTGIGAMEPARCAAQMRVALEHVRKPARIPSFDQIHHVHAALRMA
jgi:O-acetyl-ADP-ribose deacetylase (regulator of RNase III)